MEEMVGSLAVLIDGVFAGVEGESDISSLLLSLFF